jgi:baculoviral IAP repeat-containing protein 6
VDENKLHVMKAIIFAPNDTPYDGGCFEFDIYFPPEYPNVPPKMLITTGRGIARFNPNLYSDGKVCLSLLGTWRGRNALEKWTKASNIWQVLISIQSSILGEKWPIINEPGHENDLGTERGEKDKYVSVNGGIFPLRELTIRYAMIDQIKNPPKGFEEITLNHFKYKKNYIKMVTYNWFMEALDLGMEDHANRMDVLIESLNVELEKLI